MKRATYLLITLALPVFLIFLSIYLTHDALITIYLGSTICYVLPCYIYDLLIGEFKWSWFTGQETTNFIDKLCHGIGITVMVGIICSAILVTFTMFSPWGINTLTLPFPVLNDTFWGWVYVILFVFGFVIFLPVCEEGFYRIFQASQWKGLSADIMISFFYGLMNYSALIYAIDNWDARLGFSIVSFGIALILIYVRDKQNVVLSLMARVGISFGMFLWGLFIWKSQSLKLPRAHPKIFWSYDKDNIFN